MDKESFPESTYRRSHPGFSGRRQRAADLHKEFARRFVLRGIPIGKKEDEERGEGGEGVQGARRDTSGERKKEQTVQRLSYRWDESMERMGAAQFAEAKKFREAASAPKRAAFGGGKHGDALVKESTSRATYVVPPLHLMAEKVKFTLDSRRTASLGRSMPLTAREAEESRSVDLSHTTSLGWSTTRSSFRPYAGGGIDDLQGNTFRALSTRGAERRAKEEDDANADQEQDAPSTARTVAQGSFCVPKRGFPARGQIARPRERGSPYGTLSSRYDPELLQSLSRIQFANREGIWKTPSN
jgi:hypothetical protein